MVVPDQFRLCFYFVHVVDLVWQQGRQRWREWLLVGIKGIETRTFSLLDNVF